MKALFAVAAAATLAVGASSPAMAADARDFTLHNGTGTSITHVYVSESENDKWEEDVLGKDTLENGEETKITFNGYGANVCKFDIKIVVDGEKSWIVDGIDLCETSDVTFKMQGGKVVYSKE